MSQCPSLHFRHHLLIAGLIMLLLLGLALPAAGQGRSYLPSLDIVLVIDESGSMWELNDPGDSQAGNPGWRIVMANMFADLLGVDQSGAQHRLAVVTFGTEAKLAQSLTEMRSAKARAELKASVAAAHANMGWTAIPEALQLALGELQKNPRRGPDVKRAIVFLSDGRCERQEGMLADQIDKCNQEARQLTQAAQAAQCPIYTIAFTSTAFSDDPGNQIYKNLWQEIASTTQGLYFEPRKAEQELLDVYIKIIRHLFGLSGENVRPPVEAPTEVLYDARPNLLQVIFTIVKYNKDITATIVRPDGSTVKQGDQGVEFSKSPQTDSYSIMRPPAGRWVVRLSGSGKVTFVDIPIPVTARIEPVAPGVTHPQGKPMDVAARVVDLEGKPVQPSEMHLEVTMPDSAVLPVPLNARDDGYSARLDDTSKKGTYLLSYRGQHEGAAIENQQSVDVITAPWLKLQEPAPGQSYPLDQVPIKAQLMLGTKPSPTEPKDQIACVAQLVQPNGPPLEVTLKAGRDGLFTGTLKGEAAGSYPLRVQLTLSHPNGERSQDVAETTVTLGSALAPAAPAEPTIAPTPPPVVTPKPTPDKGGSPVGTIAGVLGGLAVLAAAGGAAWWWFSQPALQGTLDAGGQWFPLTGRRPVTIGSDPHCKINVLGENVRPRHAVLRPIGSRNSPQVEIRALDPAAPVRVNGMETTYQILQDGDKIEIGDQSFSCSGTGSLGGDFDFGPPSDGGPGSDEFSY